MSILIGKHIKEVLSKLSNKVSGGIFLEGLNRDTNFPYIVFDYTVQPDAETKDGNTFNCNVSIKIYSTDGDSSIELAEEVRKTMVESETASDEFKILETEFVNYQGSLDEGVYKREIEFNIKTDV